MIVLAAADHAVEADLIVGGGMQRWQMSRVQ
jgi:hypothetical protein